MKKEAEKNKENISKYEDLELAIMFMNDDKNFGRSINESDFNDQSSRIPVEQGANENMREITITVSGLFNLSATNTIELYAYTLDANGGNALVQANRTSLMGYKIIG